MNHSQKETAAEAPQIFEEHLAPGALAKPWGVSVDTIIRRFEDEPGVLKIGSSGGRGKRRKLTLRIPVSVAARVYRKLTK
jgi:hypothetical protein